MKRIRVLTVIDGLGFAGGESRILSMSRGFDRERFEHSVLTVNPECYSGADEFAARRTQYVQAGVRIDDLSEAAPAQLRAPGGIAGKVY
ncbi:MAG: hypothetical protein M3Y57_02885, partial [Acidobacteriota bacterium]|nr:hypothetical protein [Acidobacteriota bacterium]